MFHFSHQRYDIADLNSGCDTWQFPGSLLKIAIQPAVPCPVFVLFNSSCGV